MRRSPRILVCLAVSLAVAASAVAQAPAPTPAVAAPGPTPLAGYIPKDGLVFYAEFQGLEAHADSWGKTAASKILNGTPTGAMMEDLAAQFFTASLAKAPPGPKPSGADMAAILKHVTQSGAVLATQLKAGTPEGAVTTVVFRGALRPKSKAVFAGLIKSLTPTGGKSQIVTKGGNRTAIVVTRANGKVAAVWWVEKKEDLVVTDDPDGVIAALDGKAPSALEHPERTELFKGASGFEPVGAAWIDLDLIPPGPAGAHALLGKLDIKGLKRVEYGIGFRGEQIVSLLRLVAPGPRTGLLAAFDQPTLDLKALPALPEGVTEYTAFSLDPARLYGKLSASAKTINPGAGAAIEKLEAAVKARTRLRLREDILGRIGPKALVYAPPAKAARPGGFLAGLGSGGFQVPKGAMLIEIKDAVAATRMIDELMLAANKEIKAQMPPPPPPPSGDSGSGGPSRKSAGPTAPEFKVVLNSPKTYTLSLPTAYAAMTNARLTIAVGKKYLVIGTMPDAAREALALEAKPTGKTLDDGDGTAAGGLIFVSLSDPRDTLPQAIVNLPTTLNSLLNPEKAAPGTAPTGSPTPGSSSGSGSSGGSSGSSSSGSSSSQPGPNGVPIGSSSGSGSGSSGGPSASAVPGAVTIRVDPAKVPDPEAIRRLLSLETSALTVDDQSIRFISRFAFPDLATWLERAVQARGKAGPMMGGLPGMSPTGSGPGASPSGGAATSSGTRD